MDIHTYWKRMGVGSLARRFFLSQNKIDIILNEYRAVLRWRRCATKEIWMTYLNHITTTRRSVPLFFFFLSALPILASSVDNISLFSQRKFSQCIMSEFPHPPVFWKQVCYANICVVNTSRSTNDVPMTDSLRETFTNNQVQLLRMCANVMGFCMTNGVARYLAPRGE